MIDPQNDVSAEEIRELAEAVMESRSGRPRLSEEQAKFMARMKRAREHGDMLSMHDCDILIQIVEELIR